MFHIVIDKFPSADSSFLVETRHAELMLPMISNKNSATSRCEFRRVVYGLFEERDYIERVHAGELLPELLFPDDDETAIMLRRHPALLWKIENLKRHLSK